MLNGSSPTADPDSSSYGTGNLIKRAVSRAVSFVKTTFAKAPATSHIPDPQEDDVELERGQDARGPTRHGTPEICATDRVTNRSVPNRLDSHTWEDVGLKLVKYWVLPTSMVIAPSAISTAVNLYQVFKTNQSVAASTQTFMLKPYFASAIVNVICGVILFPLSTIKVHFRGKTFLLKVFVTLTSASALVEIVFLAATKTATIASGSDRNYWGEAEVG